MTEPNPKNDDQLRTIVLVYGMLESGAPFWVFVAVKPSQYQSFIAAQKNGSLDLYHFEPYGEIIVSGEGRTPPDEITLKVAEMYQTDPAIMFQHIEEEEKMIKSTEQKKGGEENLP